MTDDANEELTFLIYLNTIRLNAEELLNRQKVINTKKVQLSISTIFLNCLTNETTEKFTYSHNFEFRSTDDKKEKTTKLFNSLSNRFQEILENKMEGSSFVFDYVNFLHIKFQKIDLIRGSPYIKSRKWIQNKKATISPKIDNDDKYFMYAVTISLHHHEISYHPERISQLNPYIQGDNLNSNNIKFPSERKY